MSRKKLAAGNWKMNMLPSECGKFIKELAEKAKDASNDILVCPTAVCLPAAIEAAKGTNIMVGAQNMYFEEKVHLQVKFHLTCLQTSVLHMLS